MLRHLMPPDIATEETKGTCLLKKENIKQLTCIQHDILSQTP